MTDRHMAVRGRGAIGASGDVRGNAIGPHSTVINVSAPPGRPVPTDDEVARALAAYAVRVGEAYGRLDLEVLTPLSEQGEYPVVELREVFVPPRVRADPPPVDLPRELLRRLVEHGELPAGRDGLPPGVWPGALERARDTYQQRPSLPVLEVVAGATGRRLVVLGDPGAGKSTLARYLALALARPEVTGPPAALAGSVAVVVELRRYAEERWRERTFEDFLDHLHRTEGMAPPRDVMERLLVEGRALVVFDGLDELFDPGVRAECTRWIAGFAARHPAARIVVTSRVIGYRRAALDGAGFAHCTLQDLTQGEIGEFARRWYGVACPTDPALARQLAHRVTEAVAHSRPVRELAGNPLLLTILAIIGRRQTLPRDRQGVYRHAVTVLIAHWDQDAKHLVSRGGPHELEFLDDEDRHELLRLLARRMQDGQGGIAGNHIHVTELKEVFGAYFRQYELPRDRSAALTKAMIDQLRERNFILSRYGGEVYGFVHRAFLEYLAAADIVHRYTRERAWTPAELVEDVFVRHAADPAWHEVLLLVVGQLDAPDAGLVIERFLELHTFRPDDLDKAGLTFAIQALAEVKKLGRLQRQSGAVVEALIRTMVEATYVRFDWTGAVPALGSFGAHWTGRWHYLRWFWAEGQFTELVESASSVATALRPAPDLAAFLAREAREPGLRRWALAESGSHRPDPAARALLAERAVDDPDAKCRDAALLALATHQPDDDTRTLLTRRVLDDGEDGALEALLPAIAAKWPDADTRALLTGVATADRGRWTRTAALVALAERWPDGGTRTLLIDRALHDHWPELRGTAVRLLAGLWPGGPDDDDTRAFVTDRAYGDPEHEAREQAVATLAAHWPDDDTRDLLLDIAVQDPARNVCAMAVRHFAALRPDEETRVLLTDCALHDPEPRPREEAVRALATHWPRHQDTRDVLVALATEHPFHPLRRVCLSALAEHWPDPDARALVTRLISDDPSPYARRDAVRALVGHWPDAGTRAVLADRAAHSPCDQTRSAALMALLERWPDRATRALATAQARCDEDPGNRGTAVAVLADRWPDEETRTFLSSDSTAAVAAARALVRHWPRHEDTLAVLAKYAGRSHPRLAANAVSLWAVTGTEDPGVCLEAVRHQHPAVRGHAAQVAAFTWPEHPDTAPALRQRLEQEKDQKVRDILAYALRVTGFLAARPELRVDGVTG